MICPRCQNGGTFNALANNPPVDGAAEMWRKQAKAEHDQCKGDTWCDCQHIVGQVINSEAVSRGADARLSAT